MLANRIVLFLSLKGSRSCSIVGATFCLGLDVFEMCRLVYRCVGLAFGLRGLERDERAHDEHIDVASCRPKRLSSEVDLFMVALSKKHAIYQFDS